jgi:hypothetical protein
MRKLEAISAQGRSSSAARVADLGGRAHRDFRWWRESGRCRDNPRLESAGSLVSGPADDQIGGYAPPLRRCRWCLEPQVVVIGHGGVLPSLEQKKNIVRDVKGVWTAPCQARQRTWCRLATG